MARVVRNVWVGEHSPDLPRRDRGSCQYDAYLPDPLAGRSFSFLGPVAADVSEAEAALVRLNESATGLQDTEAIARLLLRAESVASSRIEGLEVGGRRLLRAELVRDLGESTTDVTAEEVLGNVRAMRYAVDELATADSVTVEGVLQVHRHLLEGTRHGPARRRVPRRAGIRSAAVATIHAWHGLRASSSRDRRSID